MEEGFELNFEKESFRALLEFMNYNEIPHETFFRAFLSYYYEKIDFATFLELVKKKKKLSSHVEITI